MAEHEGARKTGQAFVVCKAPDICLTPIGPAQVPVPYPIVAIFNNSKDLSFNVNFAGQSAFLLNQSSISQVMGDEAGVNKGILSGTFRGEVEPIIGSSTVRVNGKSVVRDGDLCFMNNKNTIGSVVYQPGSTPIAIYRKDATGDMDPPVQPKTQKQKAFLSDLDDTREILKGEAKSAMNTVPETGELLGDIGQRRASFDALQSAGVQALVGDEKAAADSVQLAKTLRDAPPPSLPKFQMSNPMQVIGDRVMQITLFVSTLIEMGGGLLKAGKFLKNEGAVSKVAKTVEEEVAASITTETSASSMAVDGVKVTKLLKPIEEIEVKGLKAIDIKKGHNGKVAVIGRPMKNVEVYANELEAQGYDVEIFDEEPIIPKAASDELESLKSRFGHLEFDMQKTTKMYEEDIKWTNKLEQEGYTVVDIGAPTGLHRSAFYEMETTKTFGVIRQ